MDDLARRIAAERENVERTLACLDEALARRPPGRIELAAIAAYLQNVYNGMENVIKQEVRGRGGEMPSGPSWHKDLLELAVSMKLLSAEMGTDLYEYLAFRHFFVHGYALMLREEDLLPLAEKARGVWERFLREAEGRSPSRPGQPGRT